MAGHEGLTRSGGRLSGSGGRGRSLAIPGAGRRTPCAERAVMLTAVQSLRLASWEGFPPPLPGRRSMIMLDRWLTPPANVRQAFGLWVWRACDGTGIFDFHNPCFPAAARAMPDCRSSPNANVRQAFGLWVWRAWDGTGIFDLLHPYFPAEVSEIPDHRSSPNARVNQPISNGLSWLMGVTGTQSSAVSGVPRTSP